MRFCAKTLPLLILSATISLSFLPVLVQTQSTIPITGKPVQGLESYDQTMTTLITKWKIPGAALAVAYDGRLVYSRGFGYADLNIKQPVEPNSLFRIGSISKTFTAVTILKLVEEGKLDLETKAFEIIKIHPSGGSVRDPRMLNITIRELSEHSGGWDRDKSFDPMFISTRAAVAVGAPAPASCETVIQYMMTWSLDFTPGTQYAYSNFGYCILGRIIEKITGVRYEDYVKTKVLTSLSIADMQIGQTQLAFKATNEVHYYDEQDGMVQSVFPNITERVPYPYGGFYIEALDSVGGWIASAQDLVRFAISIDGARPPAFLQAQTVSIMLARNSHLWPTGNHWYALGWDVTYPNWWKDGAIGGSRALLVRIPNGIAWAVVFNMWYNHKNDFLFPDVDQSLWKAFRQVTSWPTWDLFKTTKTTSTTASSSSLFTHSFTSIFSSSFPGSEQEIAMGLIPKNIWPTTLLFVAAILGISLAVAIKWKTRRLHTK